MGEILEPRVEEMLSLINREMTDLRVGDGRVKDLVNVGIVITGGTALLANIQELAEQIFDLPVRIGMPTGVGGVNDIIHTPQCSTGVGLLLYGMRNRAEAQALAHRNRKGIGKITNQIKGLFGKFF
jgi:cell division protein FtsA